MAAPIGEMQEAHFCGLQSQTNIYGLARVSAAQGQQKILVASLRGKVLSMEFQDTKPRSKEVHFTYIPGDAEILSIDAFNRKDGIVVGITFIKSTKSDLCCQFLNIYSEVEPGSGFNLESVAQGCHNLSLDFMPYQLHHTEILDGGNVETVFLLGGSDGKVHLYREDKEHHLFGEEDTVYMFPEFSESDSPVTSIECHTYENTARRITAVGYQSGMVHAYHVDAIEKEIIASWSVELDSPILSLCLFNLDTAVKCPSFLHQVIDDEDDTNDDSKTCDIHLAVGSAIESALVYRNVVENGLADPLVLVDSANYDAVLCIRVADLDFDGQNEILIGTYGQELLIYKYHSNSRSSYLGHRKKASDASKKSFQSGSNGSKSSQEDDTVKSGPSLKADSPGKLSLLDGEFKLLWQRSFPDPIMKVDSLDLTGDGLKEIAVMTLQGLHILQHDLKNVAKLCVQRLKEITCPQVQAEEDIFQQLQSENLSCGESVPD